MIYHIKVAKSQYCTCTYYTYTGMYSLCCIKFHMHFMYLLYTLLQSDFGHSWTRPHHLIVTAKCLLPVFQQICRGNLFYPSTGLQHQCDPLTATAASSWSLSLPRRWPEARTSPDRAAELWGHRGRNSTVISQHWTWISFNRNPAGKAAVGLRTVLAFL